MSKESMSFAEAHEVVNKMRQHVGTSIFGQEDLVTETFCCFLAGGHILMTGAPGLAKTTLVRVIAEALALEFGRVQFTPDLLPSDIIGSEVLHVDPASGERSFKFSAGPVFTNLLLADEINRASPRTQSALLEAMQERHCTVGGKRHRIDPPFMVFATQNPFESEGTFPLPEAQLDRFLIHTLVPYPDPDAELKILKEHSANRLAGEIQDREAATEQVDRDVVEQLMARTKAIRVDDDILIGIRSLVRATRPEEESCPSDLRDAIWYGAGPRAGLSLVSTARAFALIEGDEEVRWQHIRRLAKPILRHRIRITAHARRDAMSEDDIIEQLLDRLESRQQNRARGLDT